MGWISDARPSPTIVVTVLALVAALAGTAVAGPQATTSAINKKKVKKIARKQINKLAPGLSVANAETANRANTANTASQAQNAGTANGVRPVKMSYAAAPNGPAKTFVNQGGIRISGHCDATGIPELRTTSTANNGFLKRDAVNEDSTDQFGSTILDFDAGQQPGILPATTDALTVTLTYRGAAGAEVSGEVALATGAAAADCLITGTLFVG